MTAPMTAVATAAAAVPRFYPLGTSSDEMTKDAEGKVQYPYGVYSALLGRGDAYTLDSAHGLRWAGVNVQTFDHDVDGALDHMEKVTAALLDKRLAIGAASTTALKAQLDQPAINRDPDDNGVVTVTQRFTATRRRINA